MASLSNFYMRNSDYCFTPSYNIHWASFFLHVVQRKYLCRVSKLGCVIKYSCDQSKWISYIYRDLIMILSGVWFYLIGTFICAFFLCKSKQICCYFDEWNQVSKEISGCSKPDLKINQHVALISGAIFINCVGENVLYHFHAMGDQQRSTK